MSDTSRIIKGFLENAPPGEYEQCSAALSSIVDDQSLVAEARDETLKNWTEKDCRAVKIEDHNAIICKEALQEDGSYVDPITQKKFNYNFESREIEELEETVDGSEFRNELQKEITKYAEAAYKENAVGGVYDNQDGGVTVVLGSESVSLSNFRTGKTLAKYTISQDGHIEGKIESMQHFFEKGNALCQHDGKLTKDIAAESVKDTIKAIKNFEDGWFQDYNDTLRKIGDRVIFKLRRKLPIMKTKINWEQEITVGGGMQI